MKTKNLIILSVWSAITIIFVVLSILGVVYTTTVQPTQWLIWMFNDWWVVFIIALIFTGIIVFLMKEPEVEFQKELLTIRSKLDLLTGKVEEIVKTMRQRNFIDIRAHENLQRNVVVGERGTRPDFQMLGHTGYLCFGRYLGRPE